MGDKARELLVSRRNKALGKLPGIRDRRRFVQGLVSTGVIRVRAKPGAKTTMHPETVIQWSPDLGETIIKDGRDNQKIGGDVMVGWLKGAKVRTLSLEERVTCPRSCGHWLTCYGNAMNKARRWRPGPGFEAALADEVRETCRKHGKVLVRLHVLGDFYSMRYLALWVGLLDELPGLNVFGFTAWRRGTEIGDGVARVREALGRRFSIRHSGMTGPWGSFTFDFPTQKKRIGDAIVCPEQLSGNGDGPPGVHCGNCGACWRTNKPIGFMEHG